MSIYPRRDRNEIWFKLPGPNGTTVAKRSGYKIGEEAAAQRTHDLVMAKLTAGNRWDHLLSPTVTVKAYGRGWCDEREKAEVVAARNERTHLELHVYPALGDMPMAAVRPSHAEDLVKALEKKLRSPRTKAERDGEVAITETLSPRTIIHVVETLRTMFSDAVVAEVVAANPIKVRKGVMPKKRDRQINRRLAVFVRPEVEQFLSDTRVPLDRRVMAGILFLAGPRPEEAVVFTWRDYDAAREPLGSLACTKVWSRELKRIVGHTKTEVDRDIPVHATLAALLAELRLAWPRLYGRQPGIDDLLVPSAVHQDGKVVLRPRGLSHLNETFKEDCARIGLRPRNVYCTRRTFITMARDAGVHKEDLQWISHGVRRDQIDEYHTPAWPSLCAHVERLNVDRLPGQVLEMPRTAMAGAGTPPTPATKSATNAHVVKRESPKVRDLGASESGGRCRFRTPTTDARSDGFEQASNDGSRTCDASSCVHDPPNAVQPSDLVAIGSCGPYRAPRVASTPVGTNRALRLVADAIRKHHHAADVGPGGTP